MSKTIYLLKETTLTMKEFSEIEVTAFSDKDKAWNYLSNKIKGYKEELNDFEGMSIVEDGFETSIFGYGNDCIHFGLDFMSIDENMDIPKSIYVYTEVNTYSSGEVCPHALGFLTKEEALKSMEEEVENRSDENGDNYYWVSCEDKSIDYIELEDENKNISFLECKVVNVDTH